MIDIKKEMNNLLARYSAGTKLPCGGGGVYTALNWEQRDLCALLSDIESGAKDQWIEMVFKEILEKIQKTAWEMKENGEKPQNKLNFDQLVEKLEKNCKKEKKTFKSWKKVQENSNKDNEMILEMLMEEENE